MPYIIVIECNDCPKGIWKTRRGSSLIL